MKTVITYADEKLGKVEFDLPGLRVGFNQAGFLVISVAGEDQPRGMFNAAHVAGVHHPDGLDKVLV